MCLNGVNEVMNMYTEEVMVSFKGRCADGCDALIYNTKGTKGARPPVNSQQGAQNRGLSLCYETNYYLRTPSDVHWIDALCARTYNK
eukprot:scaffold16942_cov164-Skeletonema_marinoi.AAC.1